MNNVSPDSNKVKLDIGGPLPVQFRLSEVGVNDGPGGRDLVVTWVNDVYGDAVCVYDEDGQPRPGFCDTFPALAEPTLDACLAAVSVRARGAYASTVDQALEIRNHSYLMEAT